MITRIVLASVLCLAFTVPAYAQDRGGGNLRGASPNTGGNVNRTVMNVEDEVKEMTDLAKAKTDLQHARLTERQLRSRSQLKKAISRYCANDLNAGAEICQNTPRF